MRLACPGLSSWFEKDADVVTPTALLAGAASQQFVKQQLHHGKETWQRPAILGIDAWLQSRWQEARYSSADVPSLLSPPQERALWRSVIEREHGHLFDIGATVRLAQQATRLIAHWNLPTDGDAWDDHADAREYLGWLRHVRRKCRDSNWILRSDVAGRLPRWLADGLIRPRQTLFVGFDSSWSPALAGVAKLMGGHAVREDFTRPSQIIPAPLLCREDFRAELEFAGRHIRKIFEKHATSIALFVPSLAENHLLVERMLRSVFFPQSVLTADIPQMPFHFTYGGSLAEQPAIAAALLLLALAGGRIHHAEASAILRSPFIVGADHERNQRALADFNLRSRRELDFSFQSIEQACFQCPELLAALKKVRTLATKVPAVQPLSKWSEFISDLLAVVGWPAGAQEPVLDDWKDQLSTLSSLGLVLPPVSFEDAIAHLRGLLARPIDKGDWSAPVHVLDATEAHGFRCDYAVAIGLTEESWPPPLPLSPLAPFAVQRAHNVPGATVDSARDERRRLTSALFECAGHTVACYHDTLSVAVSQFVVPAQEVAQWDGRLPRSAFKPAQLEAVTDTQATPFVDSGTLRGGSAVIKAQANCPFRAFAEYRLRARAPEDASFGFDARERGGFMHKALENTWRKIESLQRLKLTPGEDLRQLVREAIAEAVKNDNLGPLHAMSAEAERERLEELILEWLELESKRHKHFTVEMVEEERKFEAPGLSLQLRVDRIDRLENGNLLLLDYKSAAPTKNKLDGERPAEPQLLVYAATVGDSVDGIFFAQLKPRDVRAAGFSRHKHFVSKTAIDRSDWDDYVSRARDTVYALAEEFVQGVASVSPLKGACGFCGVKPLCRIQEVNQNEEEEE